jgi:hypothetical protein
MLPKELVPVYNSEIIEPTLFLDAFGISESGIAAIVDWLRQEWPGRMVTNGDVEQVLLQFYAQDEGPEVQCVAGKALQKCATKMGLC